MKRRASLIILSFLLAGCTTTEKGTTIGTLAGATLGGVIGHQSGNDAVGAAIGGVAGALGGYVVGEKMKTKYCPEGGEQYDDSVNFCPIHGVELKPIQK